MNNTLLPINATECEQKLSQSLTHAIPDFDDKQIDVIRAIHRADECPAELLPYLAWAKSVDYWQEDWRDELKRKVIQVAWDVHKKKGTRHAMDQLIEAFGYRLNITEWWQTGDAPGTFQMVVDLLAEGIDAQTDATLVELIYHTKPRSRHLAKLAISLSTICKQDAAIVSFCGDVTTIYPYVAQNIGVSSGLSSALTTQEIEFITINPEAA